MRIPQRSHCIGLLLAVATLISARQAAGLHHVEWDASDLSSGVYYIKLTAGDYLQIKKSILLK